jgi:DNA polymerase-3 subunit gamma/tau
MALLRVLHGASMPDPGELARLLQQGGAPVSAPAAAPSVASEETPAASFPASFKALVEALDSVSPNVAATLHDVVCVVEYRPPKLGYQLAGPVHRGFATDLSDALFRLTATRWEIGETTGTAQPSLYEQEQAMRAAEDGAILDSPLVKAALEAFPDAEVHVDGRTIHSPHEAEIRSLRA